MSALCPVSLGALEDLQVRLCRRCGREWPAFVDHCEGCPGALGPVTVRAIRLHRMALAQAVAGTDTALCAVLAIEASSPVSAPVNAQDVRTLSAQIAACAATPTAWTDTTDHVMLATFSADTPQASARRAAEYARRIASLDGGLIELRRGIATGVVDLGCPCDCLTATTARMLARGARAGQTLLSFGAARALQDLWEISPAGAAPRRPEDRGAHGVTLEGRRTAPPPPSALIPGRHARLIGRESELDALAVQWRAVTAGQARCCAVVAPAGGGKSALLQTWLTAASDGDVRALGAGASPLGMQPLGLVSSICLAAGLDPPTDDADHSLIARELANALGECAPTCVVLEDVHWADEPSLRVLEQLAAAAPPGCLLIFSYRRSFEPRMQWLAGRRIELPGLAMAERRQLLRHLLPGRGHAPARELLAAQSAGDSPLYLEQASALYIEQPDRAKPPQTLAEAMLERLRMMLGRIRRPGRGREPAELDRIEADIGEWLDRLEAGDLAERATIAQSLALLEQIDFELVIARSIASAPVARNRRVAAAVERFYAASFDERLDALRAAAREDRGDAALHAGKAADTALATLRLDDAIGYLRCAANWSKGEQRTMRLRMLADTYLVRGDASRAAHTYREATHSTEDPTIIAVLRRRLARALWLGGGPYGACRLLTQVRDRLPPQELALADGDLARLYEDPPARQAARERVRDWLQRGDLPASVTRALLRAQLCAAYGDGETPRVPDRTLLPPDDADPVRSLLELVETAGILRLVPAAAAARPVLRAARAAAARLQNPHTDRALDADRPDWPPLHPCT